MALMSLKRRYHVNAYMVLTRADHLFIHNYLRSLLNSNTYCNGPDETRTRVYCLCV